MELQTGQKLELRPLKWVQNGYTLAHTSNGFPIFIHGALPGEIIRAEITALRSPHGFAQTAEILQSTTERIPSDCPAFPRCGGCSYRHISYQDEIDLKILQLAEFKSIRAGLGGAAPEIFHERENYYRNYVRLQRGPEGSGFFIDHTNRTVPLPECGCAQLAPELNELIRGWHNDDFTGSLRFRLADSKVLDPQEIAAGSEARERIPLSGAGELTWRFPAGGFFQINRFLLHPWLTRIRALIPPGKPDCVELFCGTGLIGGFCRDLLGDYRGYESSATALRFARENFERHFFDADFQIQDLYRRRVGFQKIELLIANPPRAGLKGGLLRDIGASRIRTIIYSSCNPATLDRDLGVLLRSGFSLKSGIIFDFFPRTPHLEMVITLER